MSNLMIRVWKKTGTEKDDAGTSLLRRAKEAMCRPIPYNTALIALCFLFSSTAWLAWEYHLMDQTTHLVSDLMTMVAGYVLQGTGIGVFALLLRRKEKLAMQTAPFAVVLHMLCLIPAMMSRSLAGTLISGLLMNVFCGYLSGLYLYMLALDVPKKRRGTVIGIGYGISILGSWLLSQIGGPGFYTSSLLWIVCLVLMSLILLLIQFREPNMRREVTSPIPLQGIAPKQNRSGGICLVMMVGAVVLLFSIVNNCTFAFSSSDLIQGIRVESARLFYAAGLILAGIVSDKDRKYGAIAALSALVIPFMMLALRNEPVSLTVFWALNYFAFGFYSVYRMIVFTDLSVEYEMIFLCGFGLMIGRFGDAIGEAICLVITSTPLVFLAALLSISAIILFFRVLRPLYVPETEKKQSEEEKFYSFAMAHDLSFREREILRLVLNEKTNAEIAEGLSISENTVKFHVRNLLQKTGCKNRKDLIAAYIGQIPQ